MYEKTAIITSAIMDTAKKLNHHIIKTGLKSRGHYEEYKCLKCKCSLLIEEDSDPDIEVQITCTGFEGPCKNIGWLDEPDKAPIVKSMLDLAHSNQHYMKVTEKDSFYIKYECDCGVFIMWADHGDFDIGDCTGAGVCPDVAAPCER